MPDKTAAELTAITATEIDPTADLIITWDNSAGTTKKSLWSEIISFFQTRLTGKQDASPRLNEIVSGFTSASSGQAVRKKTDGSGLEYYTPASGGGGIALTDLSATSPIQYNSGTGVFSFNSLGFLQTSAIGSSVLAFDADLDAIASLSTAAFGRNLLTQLDAPTTRSTIGAQRDLAAITAAQSFNDQAITRVSVIPVPDANTTRVLSNSDNGAWIVFSSSSAITLTFPTGLVTGFNCTVVQGGTGQITWAGSGVIFLLDPDQSGHTKSKGQNARVSFVYRSANTYDVIGSTSA